MQVLPIFSADPKTFAPFNPQFTSCVIFCEADEKLLLRNVTDDSPAGRWGLPGGKIKDGEIPLNAALRLFKEQMNNYDLPENKLTVREHLFARISGEDSRIHFCKIDYGNIPDKLKSAEWISIFAFNILDKSPALPKVIGRQEAFEIMYAERLWRRVTPTVPSSADANKMIFRKGNQMLIFDKERRFIIPLVGECETENKVLAKDLKLVFGLSDVSHLDIYEDEQRRNSNLSIMNREFTDAHTEAETPDEIPVGMLVKRLSANECVSGYILRNFPTNSIQSQIFFNLIVRPRDALLPINLDHSETQEQDEFLEEISAQVQVHTLIPNQSDKRYDLLHKVLVIVEQKLNALSKEQKYSRTDSVNNSNQTTAAPNVEKRGLEGLIVLGSACIVAGLAARFLLREKTS